MDSTAGTRAVAGRAAQLRPELGDLLLAYLKQLEVDYVFGIPGGAIEPLYDALARSERGGGPRAIVTRHESGAAFMADGYHRQTGRLGVCCATTGPGATNLITGVASAYENRVPMLVITAQTALPGFGQGAFQESSCTGINTIGMFQHCTRYNTFVSHPEQFEHKLVAAVMRAHQSPAGPAHLSIPLDVLRHPVAEAAPRYDLRELLRCPSLMDIEAVDALCNQLEHARKVILVLGEGCSEAIDTILDFALITGASIVTTPHGKGLVSPNHPQFRGVIGFAGHVTAYETLSDPEVDTVLVIGTGLSEWASDGWIASLMNPRLIHIDSTEVNFTRSPMARLHVRGRIESIFERLMTHVPSKNPHRVRALAADSAHPGERAAAPDAERRHFELNDVDKWTDDSSPIKPQRLMQELTRLVTPNTRFLADTGNSMAWAIHYLHPRDRRTGGRRDASGWSFRASLEFASMGWAIGAAVGVALGNRGNPVVCLTGDGSMLMSGQEITVAVQEKLPVVFVVLNDGALGMVKHGQRLTGAEQIGAELPPVDFCAMAKAMGADAHTIHSPQDLLALDMDAICSNPGPTLLDVRIDPNEVPPIRTRVEALRINR